jgi:hypothetical protein
MRGLEEQEAWLSQRDAIFYAASRLKMVKAVEGTSLDNKLVCCGAGSLLAKPM